MSSKQCLNNVRGACNTPNSNIQINAKQSKSKVAFFDSSQREFNLIQRWAGMSLFVVYPVVRVGISGKFFVRLNFNSYKCYFSELQLL
jgi:hypothetical protein